MTHAVIVAHGQPSDPQPAEEALRDFALRVAPAAKGITVHSATLAAPERLETVLRDLPDDTAIYPLFMAKGWFVTGALPKRLQGRALEILDPLGVDPALPDIVAQALSGEIDQRGWQADNTDLVMAAHGSGRSRNPAQVAQHFANQISERLRLRSLRVGFVEEEPFIVEAARNTGAQALCLPFFACRGGHVLIDVPEALAEAGFTGDTLPVLGELAPVPIHIGKRLAAHFAATAAQD